MKKLLFIGLPLLILLGAGGVVGAAALGFVKIPFLPFGKKKGKLLPPPKDDGRGGPFAPLLAQTAALAREAQAAAPAKPPAPRPPVDTGPGEARLASLWGAMPPEKLPAVVEGWPPAQLGRILVLMDDEAVAGLLAALPPAKAKTLSQAVAAATDERVAKVHTNGEK